MTEAAEGMHADRPDLWPVFVISLPDAHARRARIAAQLEALSVPFEFFDAIDGRVKLPAEYEDMVDRAGTREHFEREMSDGEYACAFSHMSVYKLLIDTNLPGVIVLEDDAIISPEFARFRAERCYERGNLIQLDHVNGLVWRKHGFIDLGAGFKAGVASQITHSIAGYSISRNAAIHIHTHGLPVKLPSDWPCDVTVLKKLLLVPPIARQSEADTLPSFLEAGRHEVNRLNPKNRMKRFFRISYWKRKARRPWTRRVS